MNFMGLWDLLEYMRVLSIFFVYFCILGTQMTLVLVGKDLVLEGLSLKIEDKKVPGICMYIYIYSEKIRHV